MLQKLYFCIYFTETCDVQARNLGDDYCDEEANNEACEFDKGDCCLLDSESKRYCKENECLCKENKTEKAGDSKYTGENCGRRPGERNTISFTSGSPVSPIKVNTR
jgi:hypothetical protein